MRLVSTNDNIPGNVFRDATQGSYFSRFQLEVAMASSAIDTAEIEAEVVGLEGSNFAETPSLPGSEPE